MTYLFCRQCKYMCGFYPLPAILPYVSRTPRTPFSTALSDPPDVTHEDNKEFIQDLVLGLQYAHDKARKI